jgi:hypothetical protein
MDSKKRGDKAPAERGFGNGSGCYCILPEQKVCSGKTGKN